MNVFVDANVILDVLDQRELFLAEISPLTQTEFDKAFSKPCPDVEDMLQYHSAISANCEVIVTRNGKHFRGFCIIPWIKMLNYTSNSTKLS